MESNCVQSKSLNHTPFVSIVVPVRNRPRDIEACVKSLLNLEYPNFEIIIVDNFSDDDTRAVVRKYPVSLVTEEKINQNSARNAGIKGAAGQIVAFTDSDCVVDKHWLTYLVAPYADQDIGGVGGRLVSYSPQSFVETFLSLGIHHFPTPKKDLIQKKDNKFMSGLVGAANVSYRRKVLEKLEGFDEQYEVLGDYDLCWRVQDSGYKLFFEPGAVVRHRHRSKIADMIKQFYYYGQGQALLFKKHNKGYTFFRLKTYLFPPVEKRFKLRGKPFYLNFDLMNLVFLLFIFSPIYGSLLKFPLIIILSIGLASLIQAFRLRDRFTHAGWYILYPLLHVVRNTAFSVGRFSGAIKHRVLFT